jgi:hypothetical protein
MMSADPPIFTDYTDFYFGFRNSESDFAVYGNVAFTLHAQI